MKTYSTIIALTVILNIIPIQAQTPIPLVTGKSITPQGTQTAVGSFPCNMVLSPDGKYVVVTNAGFRQFLTVLGLDDGRIVSQIAVGTAKGKEKEGLYYGLFFGHGFGIANGSAGRGGRYETLYASRGAEERVVMYRLASKGELTETGRSLNAPSNFPGGKSPNHIAGIAQDFTGSHLYAANNHTSPLTNMKGYLTIIDKLTETVHGRVDVGGFPYAVAVTPNNRPPAAGERTKVYVSSERDGTISVVDPESKKVAKVIATGDHPIALQLNKAEEKLFIANAGSDTISAIDVKSDKVIHTIPLRPLDVRGLPGCTPMGMALSPDEKTLYVALADMNAVAVVDLKDSRVEGYIPVGWYPTSVVVSPDGSKLVVANAKGVQERNPNGKEIGSWGQYIENIIEGTVSMIDLTGMTGPTRPTSLASLTRQTLLNNRISQSAPQSRISNLNSKIYHVIYIIKENRTYDQVLGDLPLGNGDPSLCLFPREVTPNQHALAERFALLDNFYCCAEVSADGWDWSTQGMISEYTARNAPYNYSGRGKKYDFEGQNNGVPVDILGIPDVARAPGGYIWDSVAKKKLSYRNYGFYLNFDDEADRGPDGKPLVMNNTPNKKALVGHTDLDFLQFDMTYADSDAWIVHDAACPKQQKTYGKYGSKSRYAEWKREFDGYVKYKNLPRFTMLRLPRDHTSGTSEGLHSPRAMVADNDYAVGQVVEAVSNSPYWEKTAIFILEDDAQNGFDHVDAHRSPAFVISPWVQKNSVNHRFYNTDSILRTMELILGLPPMCQYDALASPIEVFGDKPENNRQYKAILPAKSIIAEVNKKTAYRSQDSAKLNFSKEDAVPDEVLNDILWYAVKGENTAKPVVRNGLTLSRQKENEKNEERKGK
jgi:YVTN family beta-propeller protein